jgi:hypothetical protein
MVKQVESWVKVTLPYPLPSREGNEETLSPGGRGKGEGDLNHRRSPAKLNFLTIYPMNGRGM